LAQGDWPLSTQSGQSLSRPEWKRQFFSAGNNPSKAVQNSQGQMEKLKPQKTVDFGAFPRMPCRFTYL
jgi:hypothetical protein